MENEVLIRLGIAAVAFVTGIGVGYALWHKSNDKTLTALQITSMGMFFLYLMITAFTAAEYSDIVAITILAITGGEPIGKYIAKKVEGNDRKS